MRFRLFAAASFVGLASLLAGAAQAAVISFSTPADGALGIGGDAAPLSDPVSKVVTLSGIATTVTEGGDDADMSAPPAPVASDSEVRFVAFTQRPAPTDWQDLDNQGIDSHNIASALADQVIAAVPEPSSWALMLVGFGGMGALLRRRRPAAV